MTDPCLLEEQEQKAAAPTGGTAAPAQQALPLAGGADGAGAPVAAAAARAAGPELRRPEAEARASAAEERAEPSEPMEADQAQEALEVAQTLLARYRLIEITAREADAGAAVAHTAPNPAVQSILDELANRLHQLHPADVAYVLEALPVEDRLVLWDLIKTAERDGDILVEVSDSVRETLIDSMDHDDLVAVAETLDADELADIAEDLPREVIEEVREGLSHEEREQLRAAMSYPDDAVGALMDFEMVEVREDVTLEVVLRYLRRLDDLPDLTDQVLPSAGGHLAALLAVRQDWQAALGLPPNVVRGCLPISGVFLFGADAGLSKRPRFLGEAEDAALDAAASPLAHLRSRGAAGVPPFLLAWGEKDFPHLISQAHAIVALLREKKADVTDIVLAGKSHLDAHLASAEPDQAWIGAALRFIETR